MSPISRNAKSYWHKNKVIVVVVVVVVVSDKISLALWSTNG